MTPDALVALDYQVSTPDGSGGYKTSWQESFRARTRFMFERGREDVQGGGLTGTASFKVKIRASEKSRAVTTEYRMRDILRGMEFNIREVDALTDRQWIWLAVESGVAI